jgi:hypothetical protein
VFFIRPGGCKYPHSQGFFKKSPEKETEIKVPSRQLQRDTFANRRKKEKPSDNQDDDCEDECQESSLGSILFHAITSWLPV